MSLLQQYGMVKAAS